MTSRSVYQRSSPAPTWRAKKFTEPPEQIKKEIAAFKADKTTAEAQKKQDLAGLEG
jgi:hypothetical protein